MKSEVFEKVTEFKTKYPFTISWRLRAHCKIIDKHLNEGEYIKYAFAAQKSEKHFDIISTNVIALSNKRILLGQKRLFFGYFFTAITPDMFNDLKVRMGLIWGTIEIDTIKEQFILSNIQKSALPEIETCVTEYMMREKRRFYQAKDIKS